MKWQERLTALAFSQFSLGLFIAAMTMVTFTGNAWAAKDKLEIKISNSEKEYVYISPGLNTFTDQHIVIEYIYEGYSFPREFDFGSITVGMNIWKNPDTRGVLTSHPLEGTVTQTDADDETLSLNPDPAIFNTNEYGELIQGSAEVMITFNCMADPCEETSLEGKLKFSGPPKANLDANNNITVRVHLVEPTACLKVNSFATSQERDTMLNSTEVVTNKKAGKVNATTPGQKSFNILIANTCSQSDSFDLEIILDPAYDTNPSNNPGNAVFTYLAGQLIEPESFDLSLFSEKTAGGQALCLPGITLEGGKTFLATVHMGIKRGMPVMDLPRDEKFTFNALLHNANSACLNHPPFAEDPAEVNYTIK